MTMMAAKHSPDKALEINNSVAKSSIIRKQSFARAKSSGCVNLNQKSAPKESQNKNLQFETVEEENLSESNNSGVLKKKMGMNIFRKSQAKLKDENKKKI